MFLPSRSEGRSPLHWLLGCTAAVWIALMLFLQWLAIMPQSVLAVEVATKLPMVTLRETLLSYVSKPLSPPPK